MKVLPVFPPGLQFPKVVCKFTAEDLFDFVPFGQDLPEKLLLRFVLFGSNIIAVSE